MKSKFRLTRSDDFKRVRREGRSYAHPLIVLVTLPNNLDYWRCGIAAGRSVGNAVKRNRCKRLLRESVNVVLNHLVPGYDFVILARQPMNNATFIQIKDALCILFTRAQLLNNKVVNGI